MESPNKGDHPLDGFRPGHSMSPLLVAPAIGRRLLTRVTCFDAFRGPGMLKSPGAQVPGLAGEPSQRAVGPGWALRAHRRRGHPAPPQAVGAGHGPEGEREEEGPGLSPFGRESCET